MSLAATTSIAWPLSSRPMPALKSSFPIHYDDKLAELLKTRPNGIVRVIIQRTVPVNAAHAAEISNAGGRVVGELDMIQAQVAFLPVSQLERMAANPTVKNISIDDYVQGQAGQPYVVSGAAKANDSYG